MGKAKKTGLSTRDLINVGIFTAIYFVIMFASGMFGIIAPIFMMVGFAIGIIANGVVVALYLARVPKFGALTILALIVSILMVLTGHPIYQLIVAPSIGAVADLVAKSGNFSKKLNNIFAYAVLTMWMMVPLLPVVWDTAGYHDYVAGSMGKEYADNYIQIFNSSTMAFVAIFIFTMALIGGWFGQYILRRHFKRAGVA